MKREHRVHWLRSHGFDGLHSPGECACRVDDLYPCDDGPYPVCKPGVLRPCPTECGEHEWHIGPRKAPR